jgi:EAL domain-containing protein (putative c-di-GMP-specific phosphodiesterase class I)
MHGVFAERLALEHRLRLAIDMQQFEVYYQPQINLATGRVDGVEALLRWNDLEHGVVSPEQFMPVLESSGLIVAAGNWALARAVADCRRWAKAALGPLRVGVNVSALQLRRRGFVDLVLEQIAGAFSGDEGYGVDLEITETALLQDLEGTSRKLRELRSAGVRIALDDFGTGYSSLGLLSTLPVDVLKIDRSFVAGLPAERASMTLTSSIIALASAFGLRTVAEGVETAEQLDALRRMHCSHSQGFLHCRPLPAADLEHFLNGRRTT